MHLATLPSVRRDQSPDTPSITDDHLGTLTSTALAARVVAAAHRLRDAGIGPGSVVATILPNRAELVITLFAAWRLGAAVTPVNPALTPVEITYQLRDSGATVAVAERLDAVDGVLLVTIDSLTSSTSAEDGLPDVRHGSDDLALLVYTSGTTGRPKGVELTHANLDAMTASMITAMRLTTADHSLLVLPLFHVNGIVVSILSPLIAGGRATIAGRFDPRTFFDHVERSRPTYFSAVPAIYTMLTHLPAEVVPDTSSLRFGVCGAAPMPAEHIAAFEARYGITLIEGYGLSEGTCASTTNPIDGPRKPGTVGVALPGQTVAIMDADGRLVTDGSSGEVVIAGPTVMRGYLNRPDETAETLQGGWLHTGDVGRLDDDGYLVLVDRVKDMIIRGGENIYPKEIENALHAHPAVVEAAVIGRPHDILGEVPIAFVTVREALADPQAEIDEFLATRLARFKRPEQIIVVDEVPKNPVGKVDKPRLRRELALPTA